METYRNSSRPDPSASSHCCPALIEFGVSGAEAGDVWEKSKDEWSEDGGRRRSGGRYARASWIGIDLTTCSAPALSFKEGFVAGEPMEDCKPHRSRQLYNGSLCGFWPKFIFVVVWAPSGFSVVVQTSLTIIWLSLLISDVRMTSDKLAGALSSGASVVAFEVCPAGGSLCRTADGQRTVWTCCHALNYKTSSKQLISLTYC